jgi:hypothetical protein
MRSRVIQPMMNSHAYFVPRDDAAEEAHARIS